MTNRPICYLLCIIYTLLLGGCGLLPRVDRGQDNAEYADVLPEGWEALDEWQPVNIDDDEDDEQLLLFRFDSGQVGALIAAVQSSSTSTPPPTPLPLSSQLYRLLPRYFDNQGELGQGIVAPPGTSVDAIGLYQIDGDSPERELLLRGGNTHLTFSWWKGVAEGYGVTQLFASGGFGVDWDAWERDPEPILSVVGEYPLEDYRARSTICRTVLYTRRANLSGIGFDGVSQGLNFCGSVIPAHPFAPEGVVLAYLLWPRPANSGLEALLTPGTTLAQLDAESAYERLVTERIEEIAAFRSVPMNREQVASAQTQEGGVALTTPVCVEFVEQANPSIRRWVVFTLRYQPSDVTQRLPDRWTLSSASREPPPVEPPPPDYCETILERIAP